MFLSPFVRGLGFPLHPFVCGLMFYYGLDFHDLAPNFILNISAFIVVCEAFLCITPHFGLWLKTFNVKPKVVSGQQEECGGAMVGKMLNVTWLEGSYVETIKGWQSGLFYITKPHGDARSKFGRRRPVGVVRLGDVEPPILPPLHGLHIGAFEPGDVGHFSHHGASALRLLADQHLR